MRYIFGNFINTLRKYKISSFLNIAGMAVAFAAFDVILSQVSYNFGYNKKLKDCNKLFVITTPSSYDSGKFSAWLCRPFGEKVISGTPMVESGGVMNIHNYSDNNICWTRRNDTGTKLHLEAPHAFSLGGIEALGFNFITGSAEDLTKPHTFAIQEHVAKELGLSVGDKVSWSDPEGEREAIEIAGIYEDFQKNSDLYNVDAVNSIGDYSLDAFGEWSYDYIVKLQDPSDKVKFEEYAKGVILDMLKERYLGYYEDEQSAMQEVKEAEKQMQIRLISLKDSFYSSELGDPIGKKGNKTTDCTLLAIAILTIAIALINFINFFFALVPVRLRSVNTYKIFGVSRSSLIMNFVFESAGLAILALALAAIIIKLFLLYAPADILQAPADFRNNIPIALLTVTTALVVCMAGSIYPALYITSFQPALVLKGSFSGSKAGRNLRNGLIVFQYVISISLIICATFIRLQHTYMMDYDMGFNKEHLLSGKMPYGLCWYGEQNQAFEDKLRSNPGIEDITWADGRIVNKSRMGWGRDYKGNNINFQCYPVAPNFLRFMGIDIIEGRDFTSSDDIAENASMIFNEQAKKDFDIDFETPAPGHIENCVTVGICKDFNFKPLQYGKSDFAFYIFGKDHSWRSGLRQMYVRTAPGVNALDIIKFIKDTVQEMRPDLDPETYNIDFFDKELGTQYRQESRMSSIISLFTAIAIIISLMGVFGLVLFDTQHRSREIAVRRVNGASIEDILKMFNAKYIAIVLISFVISIPICWKGVSLYFNGFAYHTTIHWWVFALALALILLITVVIVTLRSLNAATSNPVEQIKSE